MRKQLKSNKKLIRGQAALPTIVLVGGIMIEIVLAGTLLVFFFNNSVYGTRLSAEALEAARSGIQDALIKLSANKNFSGTYEFSLGGSVSAEITVDQDPAGYSEEKVRVVSIGQGITRNRKLEAIVNVEKVAGVVQIESVVEVPF